MTEGVIAYFSMEIALESHIPTYSGGLGVLPGDTLRAAADLEVPMVGVTLLHRQGYFYETLEEKILPLHADRPASWAEVMRLTIALNASFFNAHRMLQEYVIHAYQDQNHAGPAP